MNFKPKFTILHKFYPVKIPQIHICQHPYTLATPYKAHFLACRSLYIYAKFSHAQVFCEIKGDLFFKFTQLWLLGYRRYISIYKLIAKL